MLSPSLPLSFVPIGIANFTICIYISIYLSIHIHIYVYLSTYLSVYLSIYLSLYISVCPSFLFVLLTFLLDGRSLDEGGCLERLNHAVLHHTGLPGGAQPHPHLQPRARALGLNTIQLGYAEALQNLSPFTLSVCLPFFTICVCLSQCHTYLQ